MTQLKFKYNINHYLSMQPRHISIGTIEKILSGEHGISRDTFYRDRNLMIEDTFSIPSERLDIYAALLGVTTEDLKNYEVKVKPLSERDPKRLQKLIQKTGLKK